MPEPVTPHPGPATHPSFLDNEDARAVRCLYARAAVRLAIAAQDDALSDAGARDRNLRQATVYERDAIALNDAGFAR